MTTEDAVVEGGSSHNSLLHTVNHGDQMAISWSSQGLVAIYDLVRPIFLIVYI